MVNKMVCEDKRTALKILNVLTETLKSSIQKNSLLAVFEWIQKNSFDDYSKLSREERQARIKELETNLRDSLNDEERREKAAFFMEGVSTASQCVGVENNSLPCM